MASVFSESALCADALRADSASTYVLATSQCDTVREVEAAWLKVINRKLSEDKTTATKVLRREQYTNVVKNTWDRALYKRHSNLPEDWINRNVVF